MPLFYFGRYFWSIFWWNHWWRYQFATLHDTKSWISLKRKKIFRIGKFHTSWVWNVFQISIIYFLFHMHFNINLILILNFEGSHLRLLVNNVEAKITEFQWILHITYMIRLVSVILNIKDAHSSVLSCWNCQSRKVTWAVSATSESTSDIYTLFDGLAYNAWRYFASYVVTSNEQNVRSYYMLKDRIRGLLFHYNIKYYFAIGFYFFGKSIQENPDSVCENDVNNEQNVRRYYICQTIEREVDYSTAKKRKKTLLFWLLFFGKSTQNILILSVRMT